MTGGEEANAVLARLIGRWQGRARLWFEPDALAADDAVRGAIEPVGGGRWVRHAYSTQISGSPHSGSALVGFIAVAGLWEQSWADTFHTSGTGIMLSTGA